MADDKSDQKPGLPDWLRAKVRGNEQAIRNLIGSTASEIDSSVSGQLASPITEAHGSSDGNQSGEVARGRQPGDKPLPTPSQIIANPSSYLPPGRTGGHGNGGRGR